MKTQNRRPDTELQAIRVIEEIVKMLKAEEAANPDSPQAEYARGGLWGAKWMLAALLGSGAKDDVLCTVRKRVGPIPHIVGLAADGNRYGWDSDAG
jgi:hypothetical protein